MPGLPHESRFDEALEQRLARRMLEPPQPLSLRDGQRQPRHLAVLAANSHDQIIETRPRTLLNGCWHLSPFTRLRRASPVPPRLPRRFSRGPPRASRLSVAVSSDRSPGQPPLARTGLQAASQRPREPAPGGSRGLEASCRRRCRCGSPASRGRTFQPEAFDITLKRSGLRQRCRSWPSVRVEYFTRQVARAIASHRAVCQRGCARSRPRIDAMGHRISREQASRQRQPRPSGPGQPDVPRSAA